MAPDLSSLRRVSALTCIALLCGGCTGLRQRGESAIDFLSRRPEPIATDRPADLIPPENLRVTSSENREISLAWNPVLVGDVAGYIITRSAVAEGPFQTVGRTRSRFGTVFTDEGEGPGSLGDGKTFFYRIHPVDSIGRMSRSHAAASATTQAPPEMPSGLTAYSNLPRRVVLTWVPSEHWTVSGYGAYRAPTIAGPWQKVASVSGRLDAVYEDEVPGDLRVMYYRITALNRFGGESEMTEPVRAVTKAEPLPPIELAVSARKLGQIDLGWAPNVEPDLVRYEVWRAQKEGESWSEPASIAHVPAVESVYSDSGVGCGEALRYQVRAVDADGLISEYSAPLEVRSSDLDLRIDALPQGGWRLRWDADEAAAWDAARITQSRRPLPDRVLAMVRDSDHFDLPDLGRASTELRVTLTRSTPGEEGSDVLETDAPRCVIRHSGQRSKLLNPPAASVD